jgi:flagellin-like protein
MRQKRRGLVSLDTLILFVAIVIVVGVVAIMLLASGGVLTQKTLAKSVEARKGVTGGIEVLDAQGSDASLTDPEGSPHVLENIYMTIRLQPGTTILPLNTTIIHVLMENGHEQVLNFNRTCASECTAATTASYMVYYLKAGAAHEDGYINLGDVGKLSFRVDEPLEQDMDMRITLIPGHGPKTLISFQTPQNMVAKLQSLWPVP